MQSRRNISPNKRALPALVAALTMAVFIGLAILAFGLNALFNQNISTAQAAGLPESTSSADQAANQDLKATISQYQERDSQYQDQLQQAADKIDQLNQQNLQYQQLIQALQNAGVIQITRDGQVFVTQPSFGFENHDD